MATLLTYAELTGSAGPKGSGSIIEDLRDVLENVSATDRPALALFRKSRVRTHYVEWLKDSLGARGQAGQLEGAEFPSPAPALTTPSRLTNSVQIFAKWGQVSDLQRQVQHAATGDMFLYQEGKAVAECLNDMEHAIHRGSMVTGTSGGVGGAGRQMTGLLNIQEASGNNYTDITGTTMTEKVFNDFMQNFVDNGTEIRPSVCFVNSFLKRTISQYTTAVTRNIQAAAREQMLVVDRYEGDFGATDIFYSRDQLNSASSTVSGSSMIMLDPMFFELGFLQTLLSEQLSRTGLSNRFQISSVMTLIYRSDLANQTAFNAIPYIP